MLLSSKFVSLIQNSILKLALIQYIWKICYYVSVIHPWKYLFIYFNLGRKKIDKGEKCKVILCELESLLPKEHNFDNIP